MVVSRKRRQSVSNTQFEKIFPKEFIYFRDRSPLEIIKFFLFFIITFDTSNIVERFKQWGGADATAGASPATPPQANTKKGDNKGAKKDKGSGDAGAGAGAGAGANNADEEIDTENEDPVDDGVMALFKELYNTAKNVAMWVIAKISAIFITLVMWSAYPAIPFFAAMAGMAGVLKYIFWKFRKL